LKSRQKTARPTPRKIAFQNHQPKDKKMLKKLVILSNVFILIFTPSVMADKTVNDLMIKGNRFAEDKRYGEAIKEYEAILKVEPENTRALLLMGLGYANLNKPDEAIRYTKKASEIDPSYAAFYNLGLIYAANDQPENALGAFDQALEFNPESHRAEYQKGIVYSILKDYEGAAQSYQRSIDLNPDFDEAHIGLTGATYKNGDEAAALAHIEELKKMQKTVLAKELENWIASQDGV
jgi:tetratricopeptide (TPR) repeat protein